MLKPLIAYITTNWKILKETEIQTTIPAFCETCMQVKKQQLEPDMKKRTDSKLGKECIKIGKVQNWEDWEKLYIVILII